MVAALLSTTPRPAPRSSADDLASKRLNPMLGYKKQRAYTPRRPPGASPSKGLFAETVGPRDPTLPSRLTTPLDAKDAYDIVAGARPDSDLEAFSHNPADVSLAQLIFRLSTCTKCPNLRFLSY